MYILTGGFNVKRLFNQQADAVINQTVLDHFAISVNPKRDISSPDKITAHAIKQALLHVIHARYPKASQDTVEQFVCVVIDSILHLDPIIALSLTGDKPSLQHWGEIINAIRADLIGYYAGSPMSNADIFVVITRKIIMGLEQRFFTI